MTKIQSKNAILFDIENDAGPLRDAMVATIGEGTTVGPGLISAADKAKLDGVAAGATVNAADAALRDRATHTGEQAIGTITGLVDALAGKATPADVAAALAGLVDSSPATLDTLNELAAALGDDPDFATTVSTALGNRLRVDAAQGLTAPQQAQGRDNLGLGSAATEDASAFATSGQGAKADTALQDADIPQIVEQATESNKTFKTKGLAIAATVEAGIHSITIKGGASEGDGVGGLYIDVDNGSTDTFTSSGETARAWYRVEDISAARIRRADQLPILEKLEIERDPRALPQNPVYTPSTSAAFTRVLINGYTENGGSPVYHRHFGSMVVDQRGVIHVFYRRALGHAGYFAGVLCHMTIDHNGHERSGEAVIYTPAAGWDVHSPMACITPNGRMILTFCDVETVASGGSGAVFKSMHSEDVAGTWSAPSTFATRALSRTYGQPRVVPSNVAGERWMLLQPWYNDTGVGGSTRTVGLYEGHDTDSGVTWTEMTTPIYQGTEALNETSVAILNSRVWFAVARKNGGNLCWMVTTDAGGEWSAPVEVSWGTAGFNVAPSLDVVTVNGVDHLLLGYCDRQTDQTKWRWAKASSLMANAEVMGSTLAITSASDMGSASGYQVPVIYPNGQMLFVEFREYVYNTTISDPVGTDIRMVWASPAEWCAGRDTPWVPKISGQTTAGAPAYGTALGNVSKKPTGEVTITFALILTAKGGMTGDLQIANLPYKVKSTAGYRSGLSIGFMNGVSLAAAVPVRGIALSNTNVLELYKATTTGDTPLLDTDVANNFTMYGTLTYFTDE